MKSQPDAASRVAAEVVTQLPVPSRLGMLRFERLNEANWAMLYLDPACDRQFGLPASKRVMRGCVRRLVWSLNCVWLSA